jgi:hypothetical protein
MVAVPATVPVVTGTVALVSLITVVEPTETPETPAIENPGGVVVQVVLVPYKVKT